MKRRGPDNSDGERYQSQDRENGDAAEPERGDVGNEVSEDVGLAGRMVGVIAGCSSETDAAKSAVNAVLRRNCIE